MVNLFVLGLFLIGSSLAHADPVVFEGKVTRGGGATDRRECEDCGFESYVGRRCIAYFEANPYWAQVVVRVVHDDVFHEATFSMGDMVSERVPPYVAEFTDPSLAEPKHISTPFKWHPWRNIWQRSEHIGEGIQWTPLGNGWGRIEESESTYYFESRTPVPIMRAKRTIDRMSVEIKADASVIQSATVLSQHLEPARFTFNPREVDDVKEWKVVVPRADLTCEF